jgi:hypothetical protein
MLRNLWNRLVGRSEAAAEEHEAEREQMSPAERHFAGESLEDVQADEFVSEHLGGIEPERLVNEDDPPREGGL